MFDLNLRDKVILITGGSDGLGFSSAKLLQSKEQKLHYVVGEVIT